MKIALIMGSRSDFDAVKPALDICREFGVSVETRVLSAHRTTQEALVFAKEAKASGFSVILAAAGKAAHLPGVLASVTELPVIGIPVQTSMMGGLDSLLSIVQMPSGVPVACVGINASANAALLAMRILALEDEALAASYRDYVRQQEENVRQQDRDVVELTRLFE